MNISIITPIHEFNDKVSDLLTVCINSVNKQKKIDQIPEIILVVSNDIVNDIEKFVDEKFKDTNITIIINSESTDFQSQINLGVENIKTDYFTILEFDDELGDTYIFNMLKNIKYKKDVNFFLPMIIEVNEKNEGLKITNELVWAQQFVGENGEMGFLNLNALQQNTDFKISGSLIKKEEYVNVGGLKKNIKLTFSYEFLLRVLNNAQNIYVVPKILYKHYSMRDGSLFQIYSKEMSMKERKFWFDTAVKESNFSNDRIIDIPDFNK